MFSSEDYNYCCRLEDDKSGGIQDKEIFSKSSMVFSPIHSSGQGQIMPDQQTELARAQHHVCVASNDESDDDSSEITEDHGLVTE